jgi:hypothetical protein
MKGNDMGDLSLTAPARIFSFGGGVQSVAVLALQALGKLSRPFDTFVFANVGDDSESPDTLQYFYDHVIAFASRYGIRVVQVQKTRGDGSLDTLLQYLQRSERSVSIPVYMPSGSKSNRSCTVDFKIRVVDRYIRSLRVGYVDLGIGFSLDETRRLDGRPVGYHDRYGKKPYGFSKRFVYPLLDDVPLSRHAALQVIGNAGLPIPPKSACWFCPFMSRSARIEQKRNTPELFNRSCELETMINQRRAALGRDAAYLHPDLVPMSRAVGDQMSMFDLLNDDLACGSGYCGL